MNGIYSLDLGFLHLEINRRVRSPDVMAKLTTTQIGSSNIDLAQHCCKSQHSKNIDGSEMSRAIVLKRC